MPTGYTAAVADGRVTGLREFILRSASSLSLFSDLRDSPMSDDIKEIVADTEYVDEQIFEAEAKLSQLKLMTVTEAQLELEKYRVRVTEGNAKRAVENLEVNKRYADMYAKVEAWTPPSQDHTYLKSFMLDQLKISCDSDCRLHLDTVPSADLAAATQWLESSIRDCEDDIVRYKQRRQDHIDRVNERNKFLRELKASL